MWAVVAFIAWLVAFPVTFVGLLALSRWRANKRDKAAVARRIERKAAA